jgi:1-acyl-sn-glycerol-3-phosphate acyltransferase
VTLAAPRPLRGALFLGTIYAAMAVYALVFLPWALFSRDGAFAAAHGWCRFARRAARAIVGIETEVRGVPPTGEVLVAAKHQSFLDIILIYGAVPRGRFIMKRELLWTPILGSTRCASAACRWIGANAGRLSVRCSRTWRRGGRSPGQLIIYPQGTRLAPGVKAPFKGGAAALYSELGQACVPVACNVGLFWPRKGTRLRPGRAWWSSLAHPAGLPPSSWPAVEAAIEPASDG